MVSFSPGEYKGFSTARAKMAKGTKLADPTPIKPKTADNPMSWSYCPADAANKKWQKVGRFFRTRYRQGWLIRRDDTFQYIPDEAN